VIGLWMLAACGWFSGDDGSPPSDERVIRLVYTADVHGEIEPCG